MTLIPLKIIRQTAAEILAYAVHEIFPGVKLISGVTTDLGFYYDFLMEQPLSEELLFLIEERMRGIAKESVKIEMLEMMRQNAMEMFRHQNQPYKVDELQNSLDNIVQIWKIDTFYDVCQPPYGVNTSIAQAFKLQKVQRKTVLLPFYDKSGKRKLEQKQIIRIIGTACSNKSDLKDFLKKVEAAKKKDHRLLAPSMGLFKIEDDVFPGAIFWLPKGKFLRDSLLNFLSSADKNLKFQPVLTPNIVNLSFLKKTCKNDKNYDSSLVVEIEDEECILSPKKSVLHGLLFRSNPREINDLPIRYTEISESFAAGNESKFNGLFETRDFTSDTANIFCAEAQVVDELISCLQLIDETARMLALKIDYVLSSPSLKNSNLVESFDKGNVWLEKALNATGLQFIIDKESASNYATHHKGLNHCGPSIEMRITDALGREWDGSSILIDLSTRESLGLHYLDANGRKQAPIMITRSIFRSLERYIALLIESYAGNLPSWLLECEVKVLPLAERNTAYARKVLELLDQAKVRASIDDRQGKLGEKIHAAESERVPYMLIVGDNEEKGGTVTVRTCMQGTDVSGVELDSFLKQLHEEHESNLPSQMRR